MGREPELSTSFFKVLIGGFANKLVSFSRSRSSCEIWLPCCLFSTLMQFCYMFEIHVLTVYTTSICEEANREVACNPSAPNWMWKIMGCDDWTSGWSWLLFREWLGRIRQLSQFTSWWLSCFRANWRINLSRFHVWSKLLWKGVNEIMYEHT